jgi:hypothetical protein
MPLDGLQGGIMTVDGHLAISLELRMLEHGGPGYPDIMFHSQRGLDHFDNVTIIGH